MQDSLLTAPLRKRRAANKLTARRALEALRAGLCLALWAGALGLSTRPALAVTDQPGGRGDGAAAPAARPGSPVAPGRAPPLPPPRERVGRVEVHSHTPDIARSPDIEHMAEAAFSNWMVWTFASDAEFETLLRNPKLNDVVRARLRAELKTLGALGDAARNRLLSHYGDRDLQDKRFLVISEETRMLLPSEFQSAVERHMLRHQVLPAHGAWTPDELDIYLNRGVKPEHRGEFRRSLIEVRGNFYAFAYGRVAEWLTPAGRSEWIDSMASSRQGLAATVVIGPGDDLRSIAQKYGLDLEIFRAAIAADRARSRDGVVRVALEHLLPPGIAALLNRYPSCSGPNCMNFVREATLGRDQLELTTPKDYVAFLKQTTRPLDPSEPVRVGDVITYADERGMILHSAIYLGDGLVATKNGVSRMNPPVIQRLAEMERSYFPGGVLHRAISRPLAPGETPPARLELLDHPLSPPRVRLFARDGAVDGYNREIDQLRARLARRQPGDPPIELQFGDGAVFAVYSELGHGNSTLVLQLAGGQALRIPLKETDLFSVNETIQGAPTLERYDLGVPRVDRQRSLKNERVVVEEVPVAKFRNEKGEEKSLTLQEFLTSPVLERERRSSEMTEALLTFAEKTAPIESIGDFSFDQVAWDGKRWRLLDYQSDVEEWTSLRDTRVSIFDSHTRFIQGIERIPDRLLAQIRERVTQARVAELERAARLLSSSGGTPAERTAAVALLRRVDLGNERVATIVEGHALRICRELTREGQRDAWADAEFVLDHLRDLVTARLARRPEIARVFLAAAGNDGVDVAIAWILEGPHRSGDAGVRRGFEALEDAIRSTPEWAARLKARVEAPPLNPIPSGSMRQCVVLRLRQIWRSRR